MEFGFELALCAHLETTTGWIVARQLGAAVAHPGARVMDICAVEPGPEFADRTAITSESIPGRAIESDVEPGAACYWRDAFDGRPERVRGLVDRAVEIGFFEEERRGGRRYVRQAVRYPDWFGRLVGVENKPDLGTPGDLERQLRFDVSLALFDEVVLATESYVTRAHLNRIPEQVGVWRFDPDRMARTVVREPTPLRVAEPGIECRAERPLRTDVAVASAAAKARRRRRLAERAYGKGWRTYDLPPCAHGAATDDGRPFCERFGRVVDPATDCGADCPALEEAAPPRCDFNAIREERTPWVASPPGVVRRQTGLDRFG
ncbi:DUF5787 family protein [Haloferacaceae archaeon DSL9]